jgi:hypothetical protein
MSEQSNPPTADQSAPETSLGVALVRVAAMMLPLNMSAVTDEELAAALAMPAEQDWRELLDAKLLPGETLGDFGRRQLRSLVEGTLFKHLGVRRATLIAPIGDIGAREVEALRHAAALLDGTHGLKPRAAAEVAALASAHLRGMAQQLCDHARRHPDGTCRYCEQLPVPLQAEPAE